MAGIITADIIGVCLCASLAINLAILLYFFIFVLADLFVKLCHTPVSRLRLAHKHCADFMRNFYFETVFYSVQAIVAIVITIVFYQPNLSFERELPYELKLFFAASLGFHIVVLLRIVFVAKRNLAKFATFMLQFLVFLGLLSILLTGEDTPLGMMFLISEADMLFINVGKLHKIIRLKGTRRYQILIYMGTFATILSRAVIPVVILVLALVNGSPLKMSISSVSVFFIALVGCGFINIWRITPTIARHCRKEERIIEVPYANMTVGENSAGPKPEDIATISANMEVPPSYDDVFGVDQTELSATDTLSFVSPLVEEIHTSTGNGSDATEFVEPSFDAAAVVDIHSFELTRQSDTTDYGLESSA